MTLRRRELTETQRKCEIKSERAQRANGRGVAAKQRKEQTYIVCTSALDLSAACDAVERVMGIEPTTSAWEADVLPLNYTRKLKRLKHYSYFNLTCQREKPRPYCARQSYVLSFSQITNGMAKLCIAQNAGRARTGNSAPPAEAR